MDKKERLSEIEERIREISIEYGDLEKEARKINREVQQEEYERHSKDRCVCKHTRVYHGKSFNINYTGGACKKCRCNHFMMK